MRLKSISLLFIILYMELRPILKISAVVME